MSLPSMRRLEKACRHGLRAGGTIYVGTLPINRSRDAECGTGIELPYVATVTVDSGADYFAWSCRSAACILRSTVRMVSSSSTEISAVAMS